MEAFNSIYLLIVGVVNLAFVYYWQLKVRKKPIEGRISWVACILSSGLNAWGMDVIQKGFGAYLFIHVLQISLGVWVFMTAATALKHYAINGWSKRDFWLDYGGDLASYFLLGILLFVITTN